MVNGGEIYTLVDAGDWTYLSCKTVNPYGNVLCVMEVSGQDILDALKLGTRYVTIKGYGGFLQVACLTYDVETTVASTVQEAENGNWIGGPTAEYRVKMHRYIIKR